MLWFVRPTALVEALGVEGGYLLMFLVALLGGVSSFTSPSYYATIATLAVGGLDPVLLGVISGAAISVGDSLYFILGRSGQTLAEGGRYEASFNRIKRSVSAAPVWSVPLGTYALVALTPFPNDVLAAALGFAGMRYTAVIVPLVLGNVTLTMLTAYAAIYGGALLFS